MFKEGGKKAQITVFILMGVVLLVFFGLTLYLRGLDTGVKADKETEQITDSLIRTTTLRYYVTNCLDKAAKEAILLLGNQGGFFFKDQPYSIVDWDIPYANVTGGRAAYQIYAEEGSKFKEDRQTLSELNYPCNNELLVEGASLLPESVSALLLPRYEEHVLTCPTSYSRDKTRKNSLYTFGSTTEPENKVQPPLCKEDIQDERKVFQCLCNPERDPIGCSNSIQSQLENYIAQRTLGCFQSDARNITFKGVSFTVEDINASVTLSNSDINVKLDFPVRVSKDGQQASEVLEYSTSQPVRLKRIYSLLFGGDLPVDYAVPPNMRAVSEEAFKGALHQELDDITFDFVKGMQEVANARIPGLVITKELITDPASPSYLDFLVSIVDTSTKIDDQFFSFRFMVENRRPALDYVSQNKLLEDFDVFTSVGDTILLEPVGVDPDEEKLTYTYRGWKADEEECHTDQETQQEICVEPHEWEKSLLYTTLGCLNPVTGALERQRCGSYLVKEGDVGTHLTTILVQDSKGLTDSQRIRILVNDRPSPELEHVGIGCAKEGGGYVRETFPIRQRTRDQLDIEFTIDCGDLTGGRYEYEWYTQSIEPINRLTENDISCSDPSVRWSGNGLVMVADECELNCRIKKTSGMLVALGSFPKFPETHLSLLAKVKDRYQSEGVPTSSLGITLYKDFDADGFCLDIDPNGDPQDNQASVYPGAPEVCNDNLDNNGDGKIDCEDFNCAGEASSSGDRCCNGDIQDTSVCGGVDYCYGCVNNVCTPNEYDCRSACQRCQSGSCVQWYSGIPDTTEHPSYPGEGLCGAGYGCLAGQCIQT